ncbi:hypothetical protein IW140_005787 [Coemansia sp. RSA 1813]|nr:hypothetical protein IW140_005787 [Coemansia sp. RSA 1813]
MSFEDPVEQTYLWSWIRERFHYNKRQTAPKTVEQQLSDATWASLVMDAATQGIGEQAQLVNDLAYGRRGWLKDVAKEIARYAHPTKPCALVRDVRPRAARIHQPHRAYWIPLDVRAFRVPSHVLDQIKEEERAVARRKAKQRAFREKRLAKEIDALASAVNGGNTLVAQSGLLGDAYAYEPSVLYGANYVPGVIGNPAWIPPKIRNRQDPPIVQHVRSSIGYEFLRINARKPPYWLGARIASEYRVVTKRLLKHEFFFHMIEDLKLEEEFERRLGIEDTGYWIYARNHREFLRHKIKTLTISPGEDVQNSDILRQLKEGGEEYQQTEAFVAEHQ